MIDVDRPASVSRRLRTSVCLSILFLLVYGSAQLLAATRLHVPSFFFAWERHIPFVPLTIVPYLSIDLFFVTAPLLIDRRRELAIYATRIVTAIVIAGLFFVVMPLRFSFDRALAPGLVGSAFVLFQRADQPFNQFPSLHIALLLIVGDVFLQKSRGAVRVVLIIWFSLIAVSPVLVFQHHVIDLLGGLTLGAACLLIRESSVVRPRERHYRIGSYYLLAAMLLSLLAWGIGRFAWPLGWSVMALLLTAGAYFHFGAAVYNKCAGRLAWNARLVFSPVLVGQWLSLAWYARKSQPYNVLTDHVWIGRRLSNHEAAAARTAGVAAVIDLTSEFSEPAVFRSQHYLNLAILDLTAPTVAMIEQAIDFIGQHAPSGIVYVHCKAGYSRTSVIAASYLLATDAADNADEAIHLVRQARPGLIVRPEAQRAIELYDQTRRNRLANQSAHAVG